MSETFSLAAYETLVDDLLARGYRLTDFETISPPRQDLILRHDVDFSLDLAVQMAEAEAAKAWRAIYFVLVSTEFYNVLSGRGRDHLRRLTDMGHTVGLHFDAALHSGDEAALQRAAAVEFDTLEQVLGHPVTIGSYHRPAPDRLDNVAPLAGRPHASQPRFFSEIGYCSDSRGQWRFGPPDEHKAVQQRRALHLLTHPIWWTTPPGNPVQKLDHWLSSRTGTIREELAANCLPYRGRPSGKTA